MTKLQQTLLALNSFSLGIMLPVFNLVLLERGASLQTLPLLLAIYSITVFCFELPSGIFADLYGRKAVFLLSCGFNFISFILLLLSHHFIWLVFTAVFMGLGRAFASGSLDALFIDQAIERNGEQCLAKITSRMAVLEGAGLAAGGLLGGILSDVSGTRSVNVMIRAALTVVIMMLCLFFVKERTNGKIPQRVPLREHIKNGKAVVFSDSRFVFVFLGIFFVGFLLFSLETYWQPAFLDLQNARSSPWMLGLITFLCFFAVTIGNIVSQRLLDLHHDQQWRVYLFIRFILTAVMLIFALQNSTYGFVVFYTAVYLLLGTNNTAEATMINKFTPSTMRASILSLSSLVTQSGSLTASVFSSLMILRLNFTGIWITAGILLGVCAIGACFVGKKKQEEQLA